jgi:hypothetical protein
MSHNFRLMTFALLAAGLVGAGPAAPKAAPLVCGVGVAAPSGRVLYLPGVTGGIEAVALFNGKQLWEARDASRPLMGTADRVYALAQVEGKRNQLKVVVLDAATGESLLRSETITFPDWVSLKRDFGLRFAVAARPDKDGLLLVWKARRFHDGGEPLPEFGPDGKPYVDPNAKKAGGALRVDLETGKATPAGDYQPRDEEFPEDEPTNAGATKLNGWVLRVEEKSPEPGFPQTPTLRTLRARKADGSRSWERRIAGEPYLPPRP